MRNMTKRAWACTDHALPDIPTPHLHSAVGGEPSLAWSIQKHGRHEYIDACSTKENRTSYGQRMSVCGAKISEIFEDVLFHKPLISLFSGTVPWATSGPPRI